MSQFRRVMAGAAQVAKSIPKTLAPPPSPKSPVLKMPIHLYGSIGLQAGSQASVNADALKNIHSDPMEVREMKFFMISSGSQTRLVQGNLDVAISIGKIPITNGFVPIWNFGPTVNYGLENINTVSNGGVYYNIQCYRWTLSKPMWVPPNASFQVSFYNRAVKDSTVTGAIAISGYTLKGKAPGATTVPYAAAYVSPSFEYLKTALTANSTEKDLVNNTGKELQVERLTTRWPFWQENPNTGNTLTGIDGPGTFVLGRFDASNGSPLIADFTPLALIAGPRMAWELNMTLPPKDYLIARLKSSAPTGSTTVTGLYAAYTFGLIGSREVSL